jgi:hypothetical protein
VTPETYILVMERDGGCVAVKLGQSAEDCRGRATLDHVKDHPMMGKRGPSDPQHLAVLCEFHHLYGWATANRPALRAYLMEVNA